MADAVESGSYTPEVVARRAKIAEALLTNSLKPQPITHWAEGLAEMSRAALGGYALNRAENDEKSGRSEANKALMSLLMPGGGAPAPTAAPAPAAAPAASPMSAPAGGDTSLPRGLRNFNPLNIEAGNFTAGQPGFAGSDGRFAKFGSMDQGIGAADKLLQTYASKHGLNTIGGIVGRWAPSTDGNNVGAYASTVSKLTGFAPDQPLDMNDPSVRQKIIMAMGQHENGRPIPQTAMALQPTPQPPQSPAPMPGVSPQMPAQDAPPAAPPMQAPSPQAAPAASMAPQNPARAQIIQMLQSPNPYVQKQGQALANAMVQKQVLGSEETNDIKGVNRVNAERKAAGQPPIGLMEYQTKLKEAGKPVTNINQQQESEFQKEAGKLVAKRYSEMVDEVPQAKQMLSDVSTLTDLGKQIGTGKEAQVKAALGPYAQALGINVDKLGEIQAYEAIVNRLAPSLRVKGSGAQSDYELKNFLKSLPSLGNTPEGNDIAARVMQGLYQNKLKAGEIGSSVLNGDMTRAEGDKRIREMPDPMQEWRDFNKKAPGAAKASAPASEPGAPKIRRFNPETGKIE